MAWLVGSLRGLRSEAVAALAVAGLVLVSAFAFALAPRLLDLVADTAIRTEVSAARAAVRNLQLLEERRIPADPGGAVGAVDAAGAELADRLPEGVRSLIASRTAIVDTPRWSILSETPEPSTTVLRIQQGAERRLRFVAGHAPAGTSRQEQLPEPGGEPSTWTVLEGALSVEAAQGFGVALGDRVLLGLDGSDLLARVRGEHRLAVEIVGLFEIPNFDDAYWFEDDSLIHPSLRAVSADIVFLHAPILLSESAYGPLLAATADAELQMRDTWRYFIAPERLDGERLAALVDDLRHVEGVFAAAPGVGGPARGTQLRSGLLELLDDFQVRWHAAEALLLVVAIGPAFVAAGALGLVALMAAQRRRAAVALWRARGASSVQVAGTFVLEAVILVGPAVALACAGAVALLPSAPLAPTVAAALGVGLVAAVLIVAVNVAGGPPGREASRASGRRSPRRLVAEGLVVGLAVLGIVLLRERGVAGASSSGDLPGADPFVAAVPALAGLAAGLVAMRLFPVPVDVLARAAGSRRDLVPVLGLRRSVRGGVAGRVLLLLMATASIGALSAATLAHLDRGAIAAGWQGIGAPFRLTATDGTLPWNLDPASLPGVEAAAGAHRAPVVLARRGARVELFAIDAAAYREVVAGTAGDPGLPPELVGPPISPMPAIVSADLASGPDAIALGSTFDLIVEGRTATFRAVVVRASFPTLRIGGPFVVGSRDHLTSLLTNVRLASTEAFLRVRADAAPAIRSELEQGWPGVSVEGRLERTAAIRTSPVTEAVRAGLVIAVVIAVAYAALAVAAALALAGAARGAEVGHLRAFGLNRRESAALVLVEHGPTVALGFAAGIALGLGLFLVILPGLRLGALTGTALEIPLAVDPGQIAAILAIVVGIGLAGIAMGAILQRAADPAAAVRRGFE